MKRDIIKNLLAWKRDKRRKPLIVNGARQVGKTYALKYFGKENYDKVAYFNFEKEEKLAQYFEESLEPKRIIKLLTIHSGVNIDPNNTLMIFDEIQECPKALNSLKYFCEEANEYHIAAAGSLLGVKIAQSAGFPVGKVNFLNMYPLSFFEFLSAVGKERIRDHMEEYDSYDPFPAAIHSKLMQLLKFYFFVGGMPEAVAEYVKSGNLKIVREIQLEILDAYEKDFAKHAPPNEVMNITTVWSQVHRQLAKENKKFIFAVLRKSARGREFDVAIQWLIDAGLIYKSRMIKTPKLPLSAYAQDNIFKIFLLDVGLLGAQSQLSAKVVINGDALFTEFKGALTENYVAQELVAKGSKTLYYWASEGTAEVDFLVQKEQQVYPLEVKAGISTKKKSLRVYEQKYKPSKLLRATALNLKEDGNVLNYPLYYLSN